MSFSFFVAKYISLSTEPPIFSPAAGTFPPCIVHTHPYDTTPPIAPIWFACLFPVQTTTSQKQCLDIHLFPQSLEWQAINVETTDFLGAA